MTRLALLAAVTALLVPGAARPEQFTFADGALLGVETGGAAASLRVVDLRSGATRWRLPPGVLAGDMLVHQDGRLLTWFDAARGERVADAVLQPRGAYELVGAAQDGQRAVAARTETRATMFAVVSPRSQRVVTLAGRRWSFDALNGRYLFLVEHGGRIRLYDLATNTLQRQPLAASGGAASARVSSPDGRYLFSLRGGTVAELDTAAGIAHSIALPGAAPWGLVPDVSNDTLWAVSPGSGRVVAIDVPAHVIRLHFPFRPGAWDRSPVIGALSPDGDHIVFTDGAHLWMAVTPTARVIVEPAHVAVALGWAPDQSRVWVVGERGRVSPLRLRLR